MRNKSIKGFAKSKSCTANSFFPPFFDNGVNRQFIATVTVWSKILFNFDYNLSAKDNSNTSLSITLTSEFSTDTVSPDDLIDQLQIQRYPAYFYLRPSILM